MPMNRTVLSGVLLGPPESKTISDRTVTTFTLGFTEGFGETRSANEILVECWGQTAETIQRVAQRFAKIGVQGRLKLDRWQDNATQEKRSQMKLLANSLEFLGIGTEQEVSEINLNSAVLIGNLTADPESKTVSADKMVTTFTLAFDDGYGDNRTTSFIRVECWRRTAETAKRYLTKGSKVGVVGRIKLDRWEDRETHVQRSSMKLVADDIEFLSTRRAGSEGGPGEHAQQPSEPVSTGSPQRPAPVATSDDEPPF